MAKRKIHELVSGLRLFMKDAVVSAAKIDNILLTRLDKVRKIMETNGTFIQFPALASQRNMIRIQGVEGLHVERTVRDIMSLVSLHLLHDEIATDKFTDWTILQCFMVDPASRDFPFSFPRKYQDNAV